MDRKYMFICYYFLTRLTSSVDSLVLPAFGISYLYLTLPLLINSRTAIRRISLLYNRIVVSFGDPTMHYPTYGMDLTLEGLKMTQESRNM
jgi:hypothetical protein